MGCRVTQKERPVPKVSVIVPVYNCEPYLRRCIDSILSQSFGDFELILVDDGSQDRSGDILDGYAAKDDRVTVVHQENGGPAAARNAGLQVATCPYVYFPDSDDVLEPSLLETVIPKMEAGYDMVVFGFRATPPLNKEEQIKMAYPVQKAREVLLNSDEDKYAFLTGPFRRRAIRWEVWNRVFRRDVIEKWGIRFGCDRRIFAEDMYFTYFYVAHISRILLLPDLLYTYQRHDGSESAQYNRHLMIYSSNRMTEEFYNHCRTSEDCRYLADHFPPLYFLLHKAAIRRLRKYQWRNELDMQTAREVLTDNVVDYPAFCRIMAETFASPVVVESYWKDRGRMLQLTDRLYAEELLMIPSSKSKRAVKRALLGILYLFSAERRTAAASSPKSSARERGGEKHV